MDSKRRKLLVPYDFTEPSDFAVKHAVQFAKITDSIIVFLNVVPDLTFEAAAFTKLEIIANEVALKYGIQVEVKIRIGKVSKVIKTVAESLNVFLVIMKTQKPRGKEKYFGSRALRVMAGSKIPFLVVQAPPKRLALRRVVFPIDFSKENKEKLSWISFLSKFYTSTIYLFKPNAQDYTVRNNVDFAKRFLEGKNINYEIITAKGSFNITQETLDFANQISAEVIIIMLSRNITFTKLMFGLKEQNFISNDYNIPVLCLNPRSDLTRYESFS